MSDLKDKFWENFNNTGSINKLIWLAPKLKPLNEFIKPEKPVEYMIEKYCKQSYIPSDYSIETELNKLSKKQVKSIPFFSYKKRLALFKTENKQRVIDELSLELERIDAVKEKKFNKTELLYKTRKDKEYKEEFEKAVNDYNLMLNLDQEYIFSQLQVIVGSIGGFPVNCKYSIEIKESKKVYLYLMLPNMNYFIETCGDKVSINCYGEKHLKRKTEKEIDYEYLYYITSLVYILSSALFNTSPSINQFIVNGIISFTDAYTGNERTEGVYSLIINRTDLEKLTIENIDPILGFTNFTGNYSFNKKNEIFFVDLLMYDELETEKTATEEVTDLKSRANIETDIESEVNSKTTYEDVEDTVNYLENFLKRIPNEERENEDYQKILEVVKDTKNKLSNTSDYDKCVSGILKDDSNYCKKLIENGLEINAVNNSNISLP